MKTRGSIGVWCAALALAGFVAGCGSDGKGGTNRVSVDGEARFPEANGGALVADAPFTIIDPDRPNDPFDSNVSTSDGRYYGIVRKTVSVAVILNGVVGSDRIRVSGLIPAATNNSRSLNGLTDIACEAGVSAVSDGAITGNELDATRIANLEDAAARFVATTDFTDPASVTSAALQVRALTDNGEHPAR